MLYAHPAIKEAAIIAQRHPRRGETVKAVVALKQGQALTEDELIAWNERRVDVMLELIQKKVDDWGYIRQQLLFTDGGALIEENDWHDNFWGNCICGRPKCAKEGQNWLGETWMHIRRELIYNG